MAGIRHGARWLIASDGEDDGERWDRIPALVAAALVIIPSAAVPVMGIATIIRTDHGIGWQVIAGVLAAIGVLGLATIIGGALAAQRRVRSPVPMVLVASGTTIAVVAGMLLAPVMMASLGLG
ncbi:MAG: hypothetical protein JHC53_01580 [Thermoleophilia bacterium]|jgi:hypothetical protein|nr:hypothetical protein [Thermoleophilia bacterium]